MLLSDKNILIHMNLCLLLKNMHDPPQSTPAVCYSGCVCKKPYVLDSFTKECVLPSECPCHHGGKSYNNNETFYQGCNTWYVKYF